MKKSVITAAAVSMILSAISVGAQGDITVTVNGSNVEFDQPPVIENERTLVPLRAIFEALDAEVDWDGETRTVTAQKNSVKISLTVDNDEMKVGEQSITLDTPAKIINDRTMIPVRAVSEALECKVEWDGEARQVIITSVEEPDKTPSESASPSETPSAEAETAPGASAAPEATAVPYARPVETKIEDNVNIFDPAWIIESKEINAADGKEKDNSKYCATDYIPVNAGKSYYAGYYDPNNFKFAGGYCINYAFYDADKKFISGAAGDMSKVVKAPEYASYIRYTIKLEPIYERARLYLTFMQSEKAPEEFEKSEAVLELAETELFKGKKIFIAGDQQIQNSGSWAKFVDKRLGADVVGIKGIGSLRFYMNDYNSLCNDRTIDTFPKDADYVIIGAGFYDWTISSRIGTEISSDGGIYDFLSLAKLKWPKSQLVMMTLPTAQYAADEFTAAGLYNKLGMSTKDYSEDIKEACRQEKVPVIDISELWTKDDMALYMKESNLSYLYPNDEGGRLVADKVVEKLIELESK